MADLWGDTLPATGASLWGSTLPSASYSAPSGSNLDSIIQTAATKHGIDARLLRAIGEKESNLGKGLDKEGRGDSGHGYGIFQLDDQRYPGTTPRDQKLLDRARYDPAFAADYAAQMLATNIKTHGLRGGVRAYNGSGPKSDAYANDVLSKYGHDTTEADFRNRSGGASKAQSNPLIDAMRSLNQPIVGTASAAEPSHAASLWGDTLPKPDKMAAMAPKREIKRDWIENATSAIDAPFIMANSSFRGNTPEEHRDSIHKAFMQFIASPADANDEYGLMSKGQLEYERDVQHSKSADFMIKHPKIAGGIAFASEFVNPANVATGEGTGRLGLWGLEVISKTANGRRLLNAFSPFKDVAANAGQEGKRWLQSMMSRVGGQAAEASTWAEKIFTNLTPQEKQDVIHIHEGNGHVVAPSDKPLKERAAMLTEFVNHMTDQKISSKLMTREEARQKFFPRKNNNEVPHQADDLGSYMEKSASGGSPFPGQVTGKQPAEYTSLLDQINRGKQAIRKDWDPASALAKWATANGGRIEFEKMFANAPEHMVKKVGVENYVNSLGKSPAKPWVSDARQTEQDALNKFIAENHARFPSGHPERYEFSPPKDGRGLTMLTPEQAAHKLGTPISSPSLQNSFVSRDFVDWMAERKQFLSKSYVDPKNATVVAKLLDKYDGMNKNLKGAIVQNPYVHLVWNLTNNASPVIGLPEAALIAMKSVVGSLPRIGPKLHDTIFKQSQDYAGWVKEATEAGVHAEMTATKSFMGKDMVTVRTTPWSEVKNPAEYVDKMFSNVNAWNSRSTFGPTGEQAFATAMYRTLKTKMPNLSNEEIAGQVREALGNYNNVDNKSIANRVTFFYAWAKGNIPHWLRTMATNPAYINAPAEGMRRNNDLVGAPADKYGRASSFQMDSKEPDGSYSRYSPMLPQRAIKEPLAIAQGLVNATQGGDLTEALSPAIQMARKNLQPIPGLATDVVTTATNIGTSDPSDPMSYNAAYDRGAPGPEQLKQLGAMTAGRFNPTPLVGFPMRDTLRTGQFDAKSYAYGALGLGFIRALEDKGESAMLNKLMSKRNSELGRLRKAKSAGAITNTQYNGYRKDYNNAWQQAKAYVKEAQKHSSAGVKPTPAPRVSSPSKASSDLWGGTLP